MVKNPGKLILIILGLFLVAGKIITVRAVTCNHTIATGTSTADGTGNFAAVKPGDTVCIAAGSRQRLALKNFSGTAEAPIIFTNSNGKVMISNSGYSGIEITNSRHLKITGTGTSSTCGAGYSEAQQDCGIKIDSTAAGTYGRGISGESKTEYIEIDHVEIANTSESGITVKTKDFDRTVFTQHETKLHHNYIHDTTIDEGAEAMYIGSSDYSLGVEPLLIGVEISYNLIARSGWDGIQVGSAIENCNIHHNMVVNDSVRNEPSQNHGIINNRGSVCNIFNNFVLNGTGAYGIYVQGNGSNKIYNNVITNRTNAGGSGMKISAGSNTQNSIYVWNNTIVNMADKGISFSNNFGSDNQLLNNIIAKVSGTALSAGIARSTNNLVSPTVEGVEFTDPLNSDYSLLPSSPATDAGTVVPITTDMTDKSRPFGAGYDAGAYEYRTQTIVPTPTTTTTPPSINGDANGDGRVDESDYLIWAGNYGQAVAGVANGDFDKNGMVDGRDYVVWLNSYGI